MRGTIKQSRYRFDGGLRAVGSCHCGHIATIATDSAPPSAVWTLLCHPTALAFTVLTVAAPEAHHKAA